MRRGPRPSTTVTPTRLRALKYLAEFGPFAEVTLSPSLANAVALWQTDMMTQGWRGSRRTYCITRAGLDYLEHEQLERAERWMTRGGGV